MGETIEARFNAALKEIRKEGIKARRNVRGCCRSCISQTGDHEDAIRLWHYGGQGNRFGFPDGSPCYGKKWEWLEPVTKIWFNHDGLTTDDDTPNEYGKKVLAIFAAHGIVTDWDGSSFMCVGVDFEASANKAEAAA